MFLGDICDIVNGRSQKLVEATDGRYPIYGSGGVMGRANAFLCKGGSTVIGRKGTINRPIFVNEDFWNVDTAFGLSPKKGIDARFLFYLCKSINWLNYNKSTTLPSLVKSDLLRIPVAAPSFAEQKRIVAELDLLSSVIEKKQFQISELNSLSTTCFFETFGDPVSNSLGWDVKRIGDVASVKIGPFGSLLHKEDYISGGTPLVNPIHMKDMRVVPDNDFTISDSKKKELCNYLLRKGDVVIARRGDIGRCAKITDVEDGYLCGTGSMFVRPSEEINTDFLVRLISTKEMTRELTHQAKGVTMLNISCDIISNLRIIVPPKPTQDAFEVKMISIEKQKQLILESIVGWDNLLSSRMEQFYGA